MKFRNNANINIHVGGPHIVGPRKTFEITAHQAKSALMKHLIETGTVTELTQGRVLEEKANIPSPQQIVQTIENTVTEVVNKVEETVDDVVNIIAEHTEQLPESISQSEASVESSGVDKISTETEVVPSTTKPTPKKKASSNKKSVSTNP